MYHGYTVWSAILIFCLDRKRWVCCRRCGYFITFGGIGFSLLLGWWSYAGLIVTPIQLCRNLMELGRPKSQFPSKRLREVVGERWLLRAMSRSTRVKYQRPEARTRRSV